MNYLSEEEFSAIINDASKRIDGDISWSDDEDHSPACEFQAPIESGAGYPLVIRGSYNPLAQALSYMLIHRGVGRIYALDLGKEHRNPDGSFVGRKHKHRWTSAHRDRFAYVPDDITQPLANPVAVWHEFCAEAKITHEGVLAAPPAFQEELF